MKNLKTNKATGHDQILARAVKESAEILCQPFRCLVNFLFERGKVPSSWKLGEIVPVHKKDCTLTKTKYRPITILSVLSKFLKNSFTQHLLHTLKMFIITMSLHIEIIMGATQLSLV